MNFKRFHESKNLFDKDNQELYFNHTTLGNSSVWQLLSGSTGIVIRIPCLPSTTYTISLRGDYTQSVWNIELTSSDNTPTENNPVPTTVVKNGKPADLTTVFTTLANTKYILLQLSSVYINGGGTDNIMLNLGSQPFPYEPYSSEVWHDTPHYIHKTDTDILTTLPADIYANDVTATVGLKGNMEQNGTPTPTTPIQPSETGDRTSNLYISEIADCTINSGGRLITAENSIVLIAPIVQGKTYSIDKETFFAYFNNNPIKGDYAYDSTRNSDDTFTAPITGYVAVKYLPTDTNKMINEGSTALPYEPYGQYKIPILSNSTTTNVYLGEVQSTRQIKKRVFTGTEEWSKGNYPPSGGYQFFTPKPYDIADNPDWLMTHFKKGSVLNGSAFASYLSLYPEKSILPENATANDFKTWLATQYAAGTPVCVWYVLSTPTTGIVNEPLREIGDYADTVSGITIPTIAGANTLSVGTTLQPSEVSVNYKGWHRTELKKYVGGAVNKFNKDATNMYNGYLNDRFLVDNNTISTSSLWAVSEYIDISGISTLSAKGVNTTSTTAAICYYNDNKTFISGTSYNGTSKQTFTVPSNAKYCRISYIKPGSNAMLVEGSTAPSEYHPYYEWVDG